MLALLPLLTFIVIYLGVSVVLGDFYKIPITVAFLVSSVVAVATIRKKSMKERIKIFSRGASAYNVLLMLWIFILAGAFASSAKVMGSVDATVNLVLNVMPSQMLMAGLFLAACFVSLSMGTSVGTIVALVPIATGIADSSGVSIPLLTGVIVGGAFFGDNLSFISDTTIVATQTQGCRMSDKFRENIFLVAPAALLVFVIYVFLGVEVSSDITVGSFSVAFVLPYFVVLLTAIMGVNVILVLTIGCALTGFIGVTYGVYDLFGWMKSMSDGILGMSELIIVTLLAAGMLEVIKYNGGIDMIIRLIKRGFNGKRGGEISIALLVSLVNICTANNTIAILTVGSIAKDVSDSQGISPRRTASLLDTYSCFMQGLLPYGAQLLMAGALAGVASTMIIPYLFYPFAIGIVATLSIALKKG